MQCKTVPSALFWNREQSNQYSSVFIPFCKQYQNILKIFPSDAPCKPLSVLSQTLHQEKLPVRLIPVFPTFCLKICKPFFCTFLLKPFIFLITIYSLSLLLCFVNYFSLIFVYFNQENLLFCTLSPLSFFFTIFIHVLSTGYSPVESRFTQRGRR